MALNQDGTKTCPVCSRSLLPPGNFYKTGRKGGDGWTGYCISCMKEKALAWQRALPPDRRRTQQRAAYARRKTDPAFRARASAASRRWVSASPANKAKQRAWQLAYKKRDPERRRQQTAIRNNARRARKLGLIATFSWFDWLQVLEHFEHRCAYCGAKPPRLDLDHLVSLDHGGGHMVGNVVPACRPCNAEKWKHPLEEFAALCGFDPAVVRQRALLDQRTDST